jgi:N-acetylglucosamine-6-sulfatase
MVQSVDRMVTRILRQVPPDTYVVLTSDNGFHIGQHGLGVGKGAAYDSDIRVPLLIVGSGVRPGERAEVVSNIDIAPSFEDLAGVTSPAYRSGESLVPTFDDPTLRGNSYAFVEHTWSGAGDDPDASDDALSLVPSYVAVRSRDALLVRTDVDRDPEVADYVWEFYEYGSPPYEWTNTYADPSDPAERHAMEDKLRDFDACSGVRRDDAVPEECLDLRQ